MKQTRYFILFILFASCYSIKAQVDMKKGFHFLENGNFENAKTFFKDVLKESPNNVTAKICYGRALGLTGETKEAIAIFSTLLTNDSTNFEVQLNYAESLLWDTQFVKAKNYYRKLLKEKPENFNVLLGYANTLSNLKEFEEALFFINRAIEKSPKNNNALISRKYIRLGYANTLHTNQKSKKALAILNDNLRDFALDKETLSLKATIHITNSQFKEAEEMYTLLATSEKDVITALNGLSLVAHFNKKEKKALEIASKALKKSESSEDILVIKNTKERYIQALIWNKKYRVASREIKQLYKKYPNEDWVFSLDATLQMYKSDFKKSISLYKKILKRNSSSFNGNLGITNAYFAKEEYDNAFLGIDRTLQLFPNQKDALGLQKKLNKKFIPFVKQTISYSTDNGDNSAYTANTFVKHPLSNKFSMNGSFVYRTTENRILNENADLLGFNIGFDYQIIPNLNFLSNIGINKVTSKANSYDQIEASFLLKTKLFRLHNLEVGFTKKLEDFNANLLGRKIINDNYFINYNINTTFNLGWYNQFYFTQLSDSNQRNLFFTSLYYNFSAIPTLKSGVNYQYISFKNQIPTIYFSPESFHNFEIFIELLKSEEEIKNKNWFYHFNAATGLQGIEDNRKQFTYRFQAKFGYKFSENLLINIFGKHTNIASATVAGFIFTEIGMHLKWYY